jgi:WD40 repeat protein
MYIGALAFSPNSEMLLSKSRYPMGVLHCWNVVTGALKWTFHWRNRGAKAMAFSPDNRTLLLATYRKPIFMNVSEERDEERDGIYEDEEGWYGEDEESDEESDEGEAEISGYWITYIPLSPTTGMPETSLDKRMVRLTEHDRGPRWFSAFAFSSDCKTLAAGLKSGSIQLWDATTGLLRQTIKGHDKWIHAIAISPDGSKIASAGRYLQLWDAATGGVFNVINDCLETPQDKSIAIFQNDKTLSVLYGKCLWDTTTGIILKASWVQRISATASSPDNKILASAGKENQLRDATMGMQEMYTPSGLNWAPSNITLSLDGTTVAYAKRNKVQIWNTATGQCWRTIEDHRPDIIAQNAGDDAEEPHHFRCTAIALSANGETLALGSRCQAAPEKYSCQIQLWDIVTEKCTWQQTLTHSKHEQVLAIAFSPDGKKLAVEAQRKGIWLWDLTTGRCLWETNHREITVDYGHPGCFAFFPDGGMLASSRYMHYSGYTKQYMHYSVYTNCEIIIWDTATGSRRQEFRVDLPIEKAITYLVFSPDGQYLCIENQYIVRVFEEDEDDQKRLREILSLDAEREILSLDADIFKDAKNQYIPVINGWVLKDGTRLLWIPEEYRTKGAFLCGNTIVLGHYTGLTFIWLDLSFLAPKDATANHFRN